MRERLKVQVQLGVNRGSCFGLGSFRVQFEVKVETGRKCGENLGRDLGEKIFNKEV